MDDALNMGAMKLHHEKSFLSFDEFDESLANFDGRTIPTSAQSRKYEHEVGVVGDVTIQKLREGGANFFRSTMDKGVITLGVALPGKTQMTAMGHRLNPNVIAIARSGEESYTKCDGDGQYLLISVPIDSFRDRVESFDPSQYKRLLQGSHRLDVFEHNWCALTTKATMALHLLSSSTLVDDSDWESLEREILSDLVSSIACSPNDKINLGRPRISRSRVHGHVRQFCQEIKPDQWSVPLLARQTGIHERSLRNIFLELYGVSPKRFLTSFRLLKVREELRNVDSEDNIAQIASRVGFWQWGQMSGEYKKLFGETPSSTKHR